MHVKYLHDVTAECYFIVQYLQSYTHCHSRDYMHVHTFLAALQINEHFLPMALRYMAGGVAPVREAAADAVVVFMRHNRKQAQRTDIYCKLLRDYARAKSHWRRMTFIDACHHVVRRFSTK